MPKTSKKRVADALKEQPYPSPRTCEKLLKDSTKISVEIPSHHRLFEQIQKATKWAEKVRAALPGRAGRTGRGGGRASYEDHNDDGDDTAATLVRILDLDELEKESHGLPVSSMELQTLIKAREETHVARSSHFAFGYQKCSLVRRGNVVQRRQRTWCVLRRDHHDGNRRRRRVRLGQ